MFPQTFEMTIIDNTWIMTILGLCAINNNLRRKSISEEEQLLIAI